MNVKFYTFSKRINSTAQPVSGSDYTVILKEPSSVISPRLELIWTGTGSPTAFNYAYIGDFGRYYWVSNWTYTERKWACDLTVDVLASWKSEIGSASKYVLRAASDYDTDVFDNFYPATGDESVDVVSNSTGWAQLFANGYYVANVTGHNNTNQGLGVTLYQQTPAQADALIRYACDDLYSIIQNQTVVSDVETAIQWLGESTIKATSDLSKYINGFMWFPFYFDNPQTQAVNISLGVLSGNNQSQGIPLATGSRVFNFYLTLPAWTLGVPVWKACAPFAFYTLELMPFGTVPLDGLALVKAGKCFVTVNVDAFTGIGIMKVYAGADATGQLLAVRSAQIGVPVQYGADAVDLGSVVGSVVNGAASMASGAGLAGGAAALGSGIVSSAMSLIPDAVATGQTGNIAGVGDAARLYVRRLMPADEDIPEYGRPLCTTKTISSLSGFILCRDGDISAPATDGELRQIESYLTGGFFYD